jgi:potassium voltage-gated channel Shal-related subfamily D protein 2
MAQNHDLDEDTPISPTQHRRVPSREFAGSPSHDLSNLKLAQNQTELSKQISDLRDTVEAQGVLIGRLLEALEGSEGKRRRTGT